MTTPFQKRLFTVAEYHKMAKAGILEERGLELIDGEIIEISPIGSKHAKYVNILFRLFGKLLGEEFIISSQNPIIANNLSEPEPDFAILRFREDYYEEELPHGQDVLLIVEVADSSISYDRNVKLPLYAASGIPECWIVDVLKKEIQVYWQAEENAYRFRELFRPGDIVAAKNIDLKLAVVEVFKLRGFIFPIQKTPTHANHPITHPPALLRHRPFAVGNCPNSAIASTRQRHSAHCQ